MSFIKSSANKTPIVDTVFSIVKLAKQDIEKNGKENVYNSLFGENSQGSVQQGKFPRVQTFCIRRGICDD